MENEKKIKFPSGFFEKSRPKVTKNSQFEDIIPIKWSKKIRNGKKKAFVTAPKKDL